MLSAFTLLVTAHAIAAHMRFLSSDTLEGREPGTPGFEVAAEYVRASFAAAGLDVSYQQVPLRSAKMDAEALKRLKALGYIQ